MNPRKLRKVKFAKSILEGKTQKEAAIEAGYSPAASEVLGSRLIRHPEVQSIIEKSMKAMDLGPDAYCKEIRKGLDRARISSHIDYVDRLGALNGIRMNDEDSKPTNQILILNAIKNSRDQGISK